MNLWRLYVGMTRTNEMSVHRYTVASWQYETGYWRWAIWWTKPASLREWFCLPRAGGSINAGKQWFHGLRYGGWFKVPLVGGIDFQTQPRMDSMKYCRRGETK